MTDKDTARAQIAQIVKNFHQTPRAKREAYNEDETRHFFILPLFRALGWDTQNPADMSAETQISKGRVDFAFYISGVPAFYLETKRIREDIEKPEFIRQAINYAYLKGVTWAVLSDFEGVHVYNAEWETNIPSQALVLELTWEEYAGADFEELWLLSKPAMQERLLDKLATQRHKKARRRPVTELLFKNMTTWRADLFSQITHMSGQLWAQNPHEVDNAVQRLLDRLIFLRTAEDRGLESHHLKEIVRQNAKSPGQIWPRLSELFRELDTVYNSNLFAPALLDNLDIHDPSLLTSIINELYTFAGVEFDFNAIAADVLGAVYEQYLGFRAQDLDNKDGLKELKGKQEKRKKQGIYYTPQYIVRYIVQQTVGRLLEDGADPHSLRILDPACGSGSFLIEAFDVLDHWIAAHEPELAATERRRRILTENLYGVDLDDQAVEVTRLNLLLRATYERGKLPILSHIRQGNSLIEDRAIAGDDAFDWDKSFPEIFENETRPLWFVTFVTHNSRVSERMVTYGVERGEPLIFSPQQQVEIAALIAEACQRHRIAVCALNVLPDHVHMVIAARDDTELTELVRKIKGYSSHAYNKGLQPLDTSPAEHTEHAPVWAQKFHFQPISTPDQLEAILAYVRNNHVKHTERWGEALVETWDKGLKPLVDGLCVSPEEAADLPGGFDIIIGNPPYVRQEVLGAAFKEYAQATYETYAGTADLYVYFIERSLKFLKPGGYYGIIVANKWLRAGYGKPLRRWLKTQTIEEIIDFGDLPVFQDAVTYPCILRARSSGRKNSTGSGVGADRDTATGGDSGVGTILVTRGLSPLLSLTTASTPPVISNNAPFQADSWLGQGSLATRPPTDTFDGVKVDTLDFSDLADYAATHRYPVSRASLEDAGWSLAASDAQALLDKLRAAGVPLGDYVGGEIYYGIKTGLNEAFVISSATRSDLIRRDPRSAEIIKPFLLGRDVKRYETPNVDKYLIRIPSGWTDTQSGGATDAWGWLQRTYPSLATYLAAFEAPAARRWDKGDYWWELRPCAYYEAFEKPKILYPDIAPRGTFTLDMDTGVYCGNTVYFISSGSAYLLAILNSALVTFIASRQFSNYRGGYIRFFQDYVEQLPIRVINPDDPADVARHDALVSHVEEIIELKQRLASPEMALSDERFNIAQRVEYLDRAIDAIVYDLYGLTQAEIALVEASARPPYSAGISQR